MRSFTRFGVLALLLASVSSAAAADLAGIERVVKKEPRYRSGSPRYCLLVFGPAADTRVWLVLDGDRLYVDRNGNGDLTEQGECLQRKPTRYEGMHTEVDFLVGDIAAADGKTVYRGLAVHEILEDGAPMAFVFARSASGGCFFTGRDASGRLRFAATPRQAPIVHVGGPLSLGLSTQQRSATVRFTRGGMSVLFASVGTPGLGPGTFLGLRHAEVPEKLHPIATIEFPNKSGGPPIKLRVELNERC
jgi:hypothetical protein